MKLYYRTTELDDIDRSTSRALLRDAISLYLAGSGMADRTDEMFESLRTTSNGKPYFDSRYGVYFSVSHTAEFWAVLIGNEPCGLDIQIKKKANYKAISAKFFMPHEAERIACLEEEAAADEFFRVWTRREAYLKAIDSTVFSSTGDYGRTDGWLTENIELPIDAYAAVSTLGDRDIHIQEI